MNYTRVERLPGNPIITPDMSERIGTNINGPSLIKVPDWVANPLGRYYLYFASHSGDHIRMAYAESIGGPYTVYEPGVLDLADSYFIRHIASPDVWIDHENRTIRMYYHGPATSEDKAADMEFEKKNQIWAGQRSRVALSRDGIHFEALEPVIAGPYMRVFEHGEWMYSLVMPGLIYRSKDGLSRFEPGPSLFTKDQRHTAVLVDGDTLHVFYSNAFDTPERILHSTVDMSRDWMEWEASDPVTLLAPEEDWEGGHLPVEQSRRGKVTEPVHQLRDPAITVEGDEVFLLYSVAGESGIGIARFVE